MKTFRTYNTKVSEIKGWATTSKRGALEVHDPANKLAFTIDFGKSPKITVHRFENDDFYEILFEKRINLNNKK